MTKTLTAWLILCCGLTGIAYAQGQGPQSFTFTANSQCFKINTDPKSTSGVYIDVSGTFSLTLQPAASVNGSTYKNVAVVPTTSQAQQATITATGGYNAAVAGPDHFEVCTTGYVSGSAVVTLSPTTGVASNTLGGGGVGSGTVTNIATGTGLTGGPITGTGTIAILAAYQLPQSCSNNQLPQWSTGGANWVCATISGSGANAALSNLAAVSINTSLLAQTGTDLGGTSNPFQNLYLFGAGTYGSTYFKFTGTPTSTRTWTIQDATDTLVGRATTDTLTNKSIAGSEVNSGTVPVAQIPTAIPIGSVGSAGLSGTLPIGITSAGVISTTSIAGFRFGNAGAADTVGTAAQAATLIQGLTGCNTATYVFTPQASDCVAQTGGFSNPMTTLGDEIYGGAAGAATRLAGPTSAGTYFLTETPASGAATAEVFSLPGVKPNPQTGTTYTYLATDATTDRAGYTSFSNASSIAVTLPQAGSTGFGSNWVNVSCVIGAGTATITPTTSTISYTTGSAYTSAASTLALTTGQCAWIYSDNTNYFAIVRTGGAGTVTSVAETVPSGFAVSGSPVTTSGTLGVTYSVSGAGQVINSTGSNAAGFTATPTISGLATFSGAGAASTPGLTVTGAPYTGGSATTNFPQLYVNDGTGPTTFSTAGTVFGGNTPTGFTGNLADFHINGGASVFNVSYLGTTTIGAGPAPTLGTSGGAMFACGTAPTGIASNGAVYCDAANQSHLFSGTTDLGIVATQSQTAQITSADWTCGTGGTVSSCVAAQTISTLTFTLPLEAKNWSFDCNLLVSQATGVTANNWNLQTATNGATNVAAAYSQATAAAAIASGAVTGQASTTTTFNIGGSWTQGATGTKMPAHIWGTIEGASASGTVLNLQLVAPTVGDLVTIYRGSECRIF